jgi:hypothetical protein
MIFSPEFLWFLPYFAIAMSGKKPAKAPLGITRNHVIDKELFKVKVLEHVLLEKADQLF